MAVEVVRVLEHALARNTVHVGVFLTAVLVKADLKLEYLSEECK